MDRREERRKLEKEAGSYIMLRRKRNVRVRRGERRK